MKSILKELLSPIPLVGIVVLVCLLTLSAKGAGVVIAEHIAQHTAQVNK